jgi:hypothetical protein
MHYYQFHIGDYRSATAHLTNEEDLAYRRLLDMYYDTEVPIPNDPKDVARKHKPSNTATRGSRLPADWKPNAELAEWSKAERPDLDLRKVLEEFRDYWTSVAGSRALS